MSVPTARVVEVDPALSSRVELFISCRGLKNMDLLSKSDPFVVVYEKKEHNGPWIEILRTKTIWDNLNPDFTDQLQLVYQFERVQQLRFDVYDRDSESEDLSSQDFIGRCDTSLSRIMTSHGAVFSQQLSGSGDRGKIIIRGEEVTNCADVLHMQLSASHLDRKDWFGFGRSDPFFSIFRSREDGGWVKVWESETIMKDLNPVWKPFTVSTQVICNGDLDRPLKIQVHDWNSNGSHELIGEFVSSLRALKTGERFVLEHPTIKEKKGHKYKGSGMLLVKSAVVEKRYSFLEYIRGGCELNLIVAIDATASNGAPSTPQSLHYQHPESNLAGSQRNFALMNEYQKAIAAVGEILKDYDSDGKYPVYGFGGSVNGKVNHCFPLTFDPDHPEVEGIEGIMQAYSNMFNYVTLSGPTLFAPVINVASSYARAHCSQSNQNYTVLLLMTDGVLMDIDQTIEAIVEASELPLSIVIVGVGNENFAQMDVLDADENPLVTRSGKKMSRDIVQFVPFRKFYNTHYSALAAEVLAEIPGQVVSFMASKGIVPNPPIQQSQRHLAIEASQRNLLGGESGASLPSNNVPLATAVDTPVPAPSAPSFPSQPSNRHAF